MAEKNVSIKITAESKDAEKAISKVTSSINKMGKSSTLKSINSLASAVTGSISAFNTLKSAVEGVISTINECADAYSKQRSAELALETAAKNNPYLNASNVSALKNYATELSKLNGIADEDLLPTMTKLAQSGRTESEIMKIMSAATDVAASGVMGFEEACDTLNKTFVGEIGSLKELNPRIAQMTADQLKAGKAVEEMARAYEGTAASMGDITGGAERLKNAMTSLKEEIGAAFAAPLTSMQNFFAKFLEGAASAARASREMKSAIKEAADLKKLEESGVTLTADQKIRKLTGELVALEKQIEQINSTLISETMSAVGTVDQLFAQSYEPRLEQAARLGASAEELAERRKKLNAEAQTAWDESYVQTYNSLRTAEIASASKRGEETLTEMQTRAASLRREINELNKSLDSEAETLEDSSDAAEENDSATQKAIAAKAAYREQVAKAIEQIKAERSAALDPLDEEQAAELGKIKGLKWGQGFAVGLGEGAEGAEGKLTYTLEELQQLKSAMEDALFSMVTNPDSHVSIKNPTFAEESEKIRELAERIAELGGATGDAQAMIDSFNETQKRLIEQIKYARVEALNEALSTLDLDTEEGMAEAERIAEEKGKILGLEWGRGFAFALTEETEGKVFYTFDELDERINSIADSLSSLVANSGGAITLNDGFVQDQLKKLEAMRDALKELAPEAAAAADEGFDEWLEKLEELKSALEEAMPKPDEWRQLSDQFLEFSERLEELRGNIPDAELEKLEEQLDAVKEALTAPELDGWQKLVKETEDIYARIAELEVKAKEAASDEKTKLEEKYLEEIERLNEVAAKKAADAWDTYVKEIKEKLTSVASQISSAISQAASTLSSACELMLETCENRLDATLAKLETAYLSGEMDEEEYNEAVLKAKKEAAQEEYKIEMWEWSASILTATANIAEGVTKAIAQGGVAGIVTGALVSAAGAVQLASIIASKPTPPTYSTGGIVGGTSYTGDRVQALLNSGEMVLNAGQQRNLFDSINSGNIGTGDSRGMSNSTQIMVNNSAANIVSAEPQVTENQINVMIDMRVNKSMSKGRYSKALTQAEQAQSGKWYGY